MFFLEYLHILEYFRIFFFNSGIFSEHRMPSQFRKKNIMLIDSNIATAALMHCYGHLSITIFCFYPRNKEKIPSPIAVMRKNT